MLTINLNRPINGSKNRPTWTVPAEHSHARQTADDILSGEKAEKSINH